MRVIEVAGVFERDFLLVRQMFVHAVGGSEEERLSFSENRQRWHIHVQRLED